VALVKSYRRLVTNPPGRKRDPRIKHSRPLLAGLLAVSLAAAGPAFAELNVRTDLVPLGIASNNAAGDGVTDDAPVLRAVARHMRDRAGTVLFPPGRYRLESTVVFSQDPGKDLSLQGDHAVILGPAPVLMAVQSRPLAEKKLTRPSGAFDTVLHVPDVEGLAVGDLVGVHSRRSSEWPTEQGDNSGGVEHLAHIAAIDTNALTVTLSAPLPWHQKASNNIFQHLRKHGYYRFDMQGFGFELTDGAKPGMAGWPTAMGFTRMKDVTLKNMTCKYLGAEPTHPQGWGFRFNMVHGLYAENLDFFRTWYSLAQIAGCSDHTFVRCSGFRVACTFNLSDSTHTTIRDGSSYGFSAPLDTHRGVNHLLISGYRSVGACDRSFRNIAATSTIRDSSFAGGGVSIGAYEDRLQNETYVVRVEGRGLDRVAIDDVLTLTSNMTAAVVSVVERGTNAVTLIAYQLLGKGKGETEMGSRSSGRGGWPVAIAAKPAVTGHVTFVEYIQVHYGRSVIENCTFEASASQNPAIQIGATFAAEVRNVTIVRPAIGVRVMRHGRLWNDTTRLEGVRVIEPRVAAFYLGNFCGVDLVGCEAIGVGRQGVGIACQDGMAQVVRLTDCRFRGLATALDFKGVLRATRLTIEDCDTGLILNRTPEVRLVDFRNGADAPLVRGRTGLMKLVATPMLTPGETVAAALPHTAFFDPAAQRLRFRTADGWRGEDGNLLKQE